MAGLETIEGIGPVFAEKLQSVGVTNIEGLLDAGKTKKGRDDLAEKSGIDYSRILRFVNHADLMRISGIGGEYSELLEAAGVDSVPELAQRNPENLHAKIEEVNAEKSLVRNVAGLSQVQDWVQQAKDLPRVVEH